MSEINDNLGNTPPSGSDAADFGSTPEDISSSADYAENGAASGESEQANEPLFAQSDEVNSFLGVGSDEIQNKKAQADKSKGENPEASGEEKADDEISNADDPQAGEQEEKAPDDEKEFEPGEDDREIKKTDSKLLKYFKKQNNKLISGRAALETELNELKSFGSKEDIEKSKAFYDLLTGEKEMDGQRVFRTDEAASYLFDQMPQNAISLINELVAQPNPINPQESIFEAILSSRPVQEYIQERFLQPETDPKLAEVPPELRDAYGTLPEELKAAFEYASDAERQAMLRQSQKLVEIDRAEAMKQTEKMRAEAENARIARARDEAEFERDVYTATQANADLITGEFANSLKAIPFAPDSIQNSFLQAAVKDMVLTAVTMTDHPAGIDALKNLKEIGVAIPADAAQLVRDLETATREAERFKRLGRAEDFKKKASDITTIQKQLIGRQNEVSASIAKAFGAINKSHSEQKELLLSGKKSRPAISGDGSGNFKPAPDYSRLSMADIVSKLT